MSFYVAESYFLAPRSPNNICTCEDLVSHGTGQEGCDKHYHSVSRLTAVIGSRGQAWTCSDQHRRIILTNKGYTAEPLSMRVIVPELSRAKQDAQR